MKIIMMLVVVVILKFPEKDRRKTQKFLERLGALLAGIQNWILPAVTETC
jgi:hypothetical protein